jgi:transcriptional regulator with XRE-family HTH domain
LFAQKDFYGMISPSKEHPQMKNKRICRALKKARKISGLSLRDIEHKSKGKISNAYVCQLENGVEDAPHPHKLRVLSKILQVDYLYLMLVAGYITARELRGKYGA